MIANEEDLQSVLGIEVAHADVTGGVLDVDGYRAAAERVAREFGVQRVAVTLRESLSASDNGWSAVLYDAATETRSIRASATPCGWSIASAAATVSRPV